MVPFRNKSVQFKIVLIITVISTISVLLSLVINVSTKIIEAKNNFRADAIKDAKLLGDYCVMPIEFNYPSRAREVLNTRISRGNIYCAAVYKKNGDLFISACQNNINIPQKITTKQSTIIFEGDELFVIEPIIHNDALYGFVSLRYHTGVRSEINRQIYTSLLLLFAIIILSFILALHLQKHISIPILMLAEKVSKISETQNYKTQITKINNDEIGVLYERFNQMLKAINIRELERDKAEAALLLSEEKFRNIFNFSLDGIVVTDMDNNILEASSMMEDIFNIPIEKLKNMSMIDIMPASFRKEKDLIINELYKNGKFSFVINYSREGNTDLHLEFSSKIILFNGENAVLSLISNITKRIKADEALRESEERYKKLVDNFPSAIALHRNEEILFVNDMIKTTLKGKKKHDFIGKNILELIPNSYKKTIASHFKSVEGLNNTEPTLEVKMNMLNDEEIDVEISSIPLFFNKEKAILSVFKDISIRKKVENDLVVALKHAKESDRLKSSFLANMSHEIRTPMNGIIGFADLLSKKDIKTEEIDKYVEVIKSSSNKLLSIINDIIDISKIEAGVINIFREVFDFNELIDEICQFFLPQIEKKGLKLLIERDSESSIQLNSDRGKISQIITNLLSNSLKFTKNGDIKISYILNSEKNIIQLKVQDSGIGIPKEQVESIFERFSQANHYLQNFNEGTGLGLAICKGFVGALGGSIWAESESGKGASFYFEFPYKEDSSEQILLTNSLDNKEKPNLKNKTILIVEDEEFNYLYLKELLESIGANVLWADDGLKAIQFILNNPEIDFVLMDIKLPIMDGFTAAKKIKSIRQDIPIVAQTAYALEGDREKSMTAGLDNYISKPIIKDELFSIINKYI